MKKKCSSCKKIQSFDMFWKNKRSKDGYGFRCKDCHRTNYKEYYCEYNKQDKRKKQIANWRKKNKIKMNEKNKEDREKLVNWYVIQLIKKHSNLESRDIPEWLIDAKRNEIKLKRIIKESNNGKK